MSFDADLSAYTAAQIIAALGCPRSTAYEWKDGRRQPPLWQQSVFLHVIAAHSKRHNKTVIATDTSRLAVKAGSKRKRG